MSDEIGVSIDPEGMVATVELRRPPHNYFDLEVLTELADAVDAVAEDRTARAIVLCSEGKDFCGGADFASRASTHEGRAASYAQAARMVRSRLPVVAAVQGAAVGGGLGLAMVADFRVATHTTRFIARFGDIGIHQGFGLSATLPAAIGQQRSRELLYAGGEVAGRDAVGFGLADRFVTRPAELRPMARDLAHAMAVQAPLAVQSMRDTLRRDLLESLEGAIEHELDEQRRLMTTADRAEAAGALREKRPPRFVGA